MMGRVAMQITADPGISVSHEFGDVADGDSSRFEVIDHRDRGGSILGPRVGLIWASNQKRAWVGFGLVASSERWVVERVDDLRRGGWVRSS